MEGGREIERKRGRETVRQGKKRTIERHEER